MQKNVFVFLFNSDYISSYIPKYVGRWRIAKKNSGLVNIVIHHSGPFFNFNLGGVRHVFSLVFLLSELYVYTTAFSHVPSCYHYEQSIHQQRKIVQMFLWLPLLKKNRFSDAKSYENHLTFWVFFLTWTIRIAVPEAKLVHLPHK